MDIMKELKEARNTAGLSQQKMSDALGIPKRTIENWETGKRKCPEWTAKLIMDKLKTMGNNL